MERRKQHLHDTPPSWIDPSLCWDGYTSALPVESHLLRAATPTEGPICAENPGRKEGREDGVKQHQAICGYEAALQRRTKGNSRVADMMETSLAGDSDGKPAFWPSGVRSGLQTAARSVASDGDGGVERHQARGRNAKSRSVILSGILPNGRISRRPGPSTTAARTQCRPLRHTSSSRPQRAAA